MATQAGIRTEAGHLAPPRGRGRPKGSANLSSEERRLKQKTGEIDYTRVDNKFNRPEDFAVYVAGYPDKTGLMASLYRQMPKIDVTLIGIEDFWIHRTLDEAEMTKEWIGDNYGRGKYMLMLNDANRPHGQREVATTFFDLLGHPKPPVYDPRTLVLSEPKNLDEINRQINAGVMMRGKDGVPRIRTHEDGPVAAPVTMQQQSRSSGDLIGDELVKGIVAKALGGLGGMDAGQQMSHVIEIAKLLQRQEPAMNPEQLTEQIIQRIESRFTKSNGAGDIFENYERVETMIKKFAPPAVAANGKPSMWSEARLIVGDIFQALPHVFAGLTQLQAVRNQQPRRPQSMRRVNIPPAIDGQAPAGPQQPSQALMTLQERAVEVVTMSFEAMGRGTTGRDFASFLFYFHPGGDEILDLLASQGGTQAVMGLIAMSPEMAKLVTPQNRATVEKFLNEVLEFQPEGAAQEDPVQV